MLRRQFETIEQRGMSIAEYESRFLQLSRHAPDLVATEAERVRRFLIVLPAQTQQDCQWMVFMGSSFEDFVDYLRKRETLARQAHGGSENRQRQQGEYSGVRTAGTSRGESSQGRRQGRF